MIGLPLTLNHQKEQLSVAYIRAVAAAAGFSCTKPEVDDDSVDIIVSCSGTYGDNVVLRSPRVEMQAKATAAVFAQEDTVLKFPLPVKNYDDLRGTTLVPRLLVVMVVPENADDWIEQNDERLLIHHCAYWVSLRGYAETDNSRTVTVDIPREQIFNVENLQALMERVSRRAPL